MRRRIAQAILSSWRGRTSSVAPRRADRAASSSRSVAGGQRGAVVDEAHRAHAGRDQQAGRGGVGHGLVLGQRVGVDRRGVVEVDERLGGDQPGHARRGSAAAERSPRLDGGPRRRPGPRERHGGRRPLGRSQAHVAAGEGQPVGLAHDRAAHDLDGQRRGRAPCGAPRPAAGSPSRRSRPGRGRRWRTAWPPRWPPRRSGPGARRPPRRRSPRAPRRWSPAARARSGTSRPPRARRRGRRRPRRTPAGRARGCAGSWRCRRGRRTAAG